MKKLLILLVPLYLAVLSFIYSAVSMAVKPQVSPTRFDSVDVANLDEEKLWNLVQDWRESQGLARYIKSDELCRIAEDRAEDQKNGLDNHAGFKAKYYSYPYVLSENCAVSSNEKRILGGWLNSPPHLAALQKPYTHSCIKTKGRYAVQIFSSFQQ